MRVRSPLGAGARPTGRRNGVIELRLVPPVLTFGKVRSSWFAHWRRRRVAWGFGVGLDSSDAGTVRGPTSR